MDTVDITEVALELLKKVHEADPHSTQILLDHKVETNGKPLLIEELIVAEDGRMSTLGVVNSILHATGNDRIAALVSDDRDIIVGFKRYKNED